MKKNKGFTLIELLIAVAVLSIMTAVLFQTFVISKRMNTKAHGEERVLDAAKRSMEELKGYSFEALDLLAEMNSTGNVEIAGRMYDYGPLEEAAEGTEMEAAGLYTEAVGPGRETDSLNADSAAVGLDTDGANMAGLRTGAIGTALDVREGGRQGYRLVTEYGRNPADPAGRAAYLICADADWGRYNLEEEEADQTSFSVNRYRMPNIADVSSFQNVVLDPRILARDDELLMGELLLKVNPEEDDDDASGEGDASEEGGAGGNDSGAGSEDSEDEEDDDAETIYDESQIHKYLRVMIKESGSGAQKDGLLTVQVKAVYTVDEPESGLPDSLAELDPALSLTADLISFKKRVTPDTKTGEPQNRIYLFLPDQGKAVAGAAGKAKSGTAKKAGRELSEKGLEEGAGGNGSVDFERLFLSGDLDQSFELYVVAFAESGLIRDQFFVFEPGTSAMIFEDEEAGGDEIQDQKDDEPGKLMIFTNIGGGKPVSLYRPEKRLYRLTVTVYEADYREAGEAEKPAFGREILKLDSTKTE